MIPGLVRVASGSGQRNWPLGLGLGLVAVLYVAAVIAFIILY